MKKFVLLSALTFISAPVLANNFVDGNTEMYCQTNTNKQILLKADGYSVTYMFGKSLNQPEIVLTKPYNQVELEYHYSREANGAGGLWVNLPNGAYRYEIYNGTNDEGRTFAGISVYKNGKQLADVKCAHSLYVSSNSKLIELAIQRGQ